MSQNYAPFDPNYGRGTYRRRIRLRALAPDLVEAALEDDAHAFACRVRHDGERVIAVEGHAERVPLSTCPGAVEPIRRLAGAALAGSAEDWKRHADPRANCTHLYDLAMLAIAHAARGEALREYNVIIPDAVDGRCRLVLERDGEPVMHWDVEHGRIVAPAPFDGREVLRGFASWVASTLEPTLREYALVLSRGYFVALSRLYDVPESHSRAAEDPMPRGVCYSYSDGVVEDALRLHHSRRDFSDAPEALLRWVPFAP